MTGNVAAGELMPVEFELNGRRCRTEVATSTVLLSLLRGEFGLTGVRPSCERGVCGACTVLLDGSPAASCSVFAFDVDGAEIETIEGQQDGDEPGVVQQAFAECGGFQCGYCTSGMVMLATALLRAQPKPDREEIRHWIGSNICRCTGYETIIESVERAAEVLARDAPGGVGDPADGSEPGSGADPGAEADQGEQRS